MSRPDLIGWVMDINFCTILQWHPEEAKKKETSTQNGTRLPEKRSHHTHDWMINKKKKPKNYEPFVFHKARKLPLVAEWLDIRLNYLSVPIFLPLRLINFFFVFQYPRKKNKIHQQRGELNFTLINSFCNARPDGHEFYKASGTAVEREKVHPSNICQRF